MAVNPVHDRRTKHIDIRYHFIREFVEAGNVELYHVPTDEMVSDTLTKSLAWVKFEKHRLTLGLQ